MKSVLVELDDESVAHLSKALTSHMRWLRENGIRPPQPITDLTEWAVIRVREGQGGSPVGGSELGLDDHAIHVARPPSSALTLDDTAAQMSVSLSTVKRLVRSGALPSVRVEGRRLVLRQSIEDFLEERAS